MSRWVCPLNSHSKLALGQPSSITNNYVNGKIWKIKNNYQKQPTSHSCTELCKTPVFPFELNILTLDWWNVKGSIENSLRWFYFASILTAIPRLDFLQSHNHLWHWIYWSRLAIQGLHFLFPSKPVGFEELFKDCLEMLLLLLRELRESINFYSPYRSSHQRCSLWKGVLRNFTKFTVSCEFCKFSKNTTEHL